MTVHERCAARFSLVTHAPGDVPADARCGLCDPAFEPFLDTPCVVCHYRAMPETG